MGDTPTRHLTHTVLHSSRLVLEQTEAGADRGLIIDSDGGVTTRVRFRSAVRPEEVDGLAASAHRA